MQNRELKALKRQLMAWRSSKTKGRRIPEEIWQRAAVLAKTLGVTRVHTELKLDFTALKKRMKDPEKPSERGASFVRLPLSSAPRTADCVLKIESVSGSRMQAELSGLEIAGLSQLLREFATS